MEETRPKNFNLTSPNGKFVAVVTFGWERPSTLMSGYGKPYYPTTIVVHPAQNTNITILKWEADSESTEVSFQQSGRYLEILWQRVGCIFGSTATTFFRDVFKLPTGKQVVRASSDYRRSGIAESQADNPSNCPKKWWQFWR